MEKVKIKVKWPNKEGIKLVSKQVCSIEPENQKDIEIMVSTRKIVLLNKQNLGIYVDWELEWDYIRTAVFDKYNIVLQERFMKFKKYRKDANMRFW